MCLSAKILGDKSGTFLTVIRFYEDSRDKIAFIGVFFVMERIQTFYWDGKKIDVVACTNTPLIHIVVEIGEVLGARCFHQYMCSLAHMWQCLSRAFGDGTGGSINFSLIYQCTIIEAEMMILTT